jgi:hypothetical protein
MTEIECQTPTAPLLKSPRQLVLERAARRRKASWKRKGLQKGQQQATSRACVSPATRDRLITDGLHSAAFEGMEPAEVSAFVNAKIDGLVVVFPWWFGRLRGDAPRKPASVAQRLALERARQRKVEIQVEAERPYVREAMAV